MAACDTRVLVTGASGYIASHICKQLLEEGYKVRGTVRSLANESKVKPLRDLCPQAADNLELVEADLLKPEAWENAVKDCQFVMHTASPFPDKNPSNPDDVIKPAVDGTLNVLKACQAAKNVKRVVLTSSLAAVGCGEGDITKVLTEEDWTDVTKEKVVIPYEKSKTLAEKAAWDFVKELQGDEKFELVTVNPGYVMGPMLHDSPCTSIEVIKHLMERSIPMVAKLAFPCVDVRDVAAAHIKAMTTPEAAGTRNLVFSRTMWIREIADLLDKEFKSQGYNVPAKVAPYAIVWLSARFDKSVRMVLPHYNKEIKYDNAKTQERLSLEYTDLHKTVLEMAYSLVDRGLIKKTKKYLGPPGSRPQVPTTVADGEPSKEAQGNGNGTVTPTAVESPKCEDLIPAMDEEEDLKKPMKIEDSAPQATEVVATA